MKLVLSDEKKYSSGNVTKIYTDKRINEILAYVFKYIDTKEFYTAVDKYISILQGFYNLDTNDNYVVDDDGNKFRLGAWINSQRQAYKNGKMKTAH